MSDGLKNVLLSTVLRQNPIRVTTVQSGFNTTNPIVDNYLIAQTRSVLPNASNFPDELTLAVAYLKACIASGGGSSGTVTSVGLVLPSIFSVTGSPVTTSGTLSATLTNQAANTVLAAPDGSSGAPVFRALVAADLPPGTGTGTVTSVGLTMPSAFTVTGSPITTNGTLAVTGAGTTGQYVRGDVSLANFPTSIGGGASVSYYLNGSINQGAFSGNTYYQMSKIPVIGAGTNFTIATNGYISQFITDANDPSQLNIPAGNWNFEMYFQASSNGGSPSFYVELYKWDGATFTLIASSSTNPEGITNGTTVDLYVTALAVPATTLSLTDRLAVRVYVNNSGRTITLHTEDNNLCQIITTFSTGITALNGLTEQVQTFATGTTGTDFNISSVTATHTLNLPVASAINTGKLSSADWTTFNNKQNAITPAALSKTDDTNVTLTLGGSPTTALLQATSLTLGWSGQLSIARGGTGLSSLGTANQLIRVNSGATALEYFTPTYISGLTIGTTGITSGTVGRLLFEGTGNVVQQSANIFWNNTDFRLNLGAVASALGRLSILSPATTGLAIQVRNNADTGTQFSVDGNGMATFSNITNGNSLFILNGGSAGSGYLLGSNSTVSGTNKFLVVSPGSIQMLDSLTGGRTLFPFGSSATGNFSIGNISNRGTFLHSGWAAGYQIEMENGNLALQDSSARRPSAGARSVIMLSNGTASTNVQDTFQMYAADITAGNAAPHFQTENGNVIKIYRETTAVGSASLVSNLGTPITSTDTFDGYTLQQIVKALRNFQQLA